MSLEGAEFICLNEAGNHGEIVLAKGRKFTIGYYVSCDVVIADERAKGVHCEIVCDPFGRVTIRNFAPDKPILVNGSSVEIKRILLNNTKLSILDKEYLWKFPKNSSNEFEDLPDDAVSTPQKQIGIPEQPPNSCPDFKLHRELPKRFTVHNFAYCIQSDEEGNTSADSNDESNSEDKEEENLNKIKDEENKSNGNPTEKDQSNTSNTRVRSVTPEPPQQAGEKDNSALLETPKMNLINCTKDKENKSTQKKNKQHLTLCQPSHVVITSFSPRETGVKIEKSFTAIVKPKVLVTITPSTPKSVYSTPKGGINEDDESELINFHTPSTSKKCTGTGTTTASRVLKNCSMHLIDLTTPNKIRPASPYLKSALKASTMKHQSEITYKSLAKLPEEEQLGVSALPSTPVFNSNNSPLETPSSVISVSSSTDTSSVVEVTSDGSNLGITPSSAGGLMTPNKQQTITGAFTPKRTPQSLMKRAILTSAKKQATTPQKGFSTVSTTPRREARNRIPLRNNLASLKSPVTPKASTSDKNDSQLPRRHSMSTPTRKSTSARNRFDNSPTTSNSSSPSSSISLASRRSSINPISTARALPSSTPVAGFSLRNRSACKTSPLRKVRKSVGGITLPSYISRARRSIALPSSTSKLTSVKEKSLQQPIEQRKAVLFADKQATKGGGELDDLSRTFIVDSDEEKEENIVEKREEEGDKPKDATFSPQKDQKTYETDKALGTINKTYSPDNNTGNKENPQKMFEENYPIKSVEIPVDVEEIAQTNEEAEKSDENKAGSTGIDKKEPEENKDKIEKSKENNENKDTNNEIAEDRNTESESKNIYNATEETKIDTEKIISEPKPNDDDSLELMAVNNKKDSLVTEESFAEIVNDTQEDIEKTVNTNRLKESMGITASPPESSQPENQEIFAGMDVTQDEAEDDNLSQNNQIQTEVTQEIKKGLNQSLHSEKLEVVEVLVTGFGEESIVESLETIGNENPQEKIEEQSKPNETSFKTNNVDKNTIEEAIEKNGTKTDTKANEIATEKKPKEEDKDTEDSIIESSSNKHHLEGLKYIEEQKSEEYKPIYEDITLEGSLIEKEAEEPNLIKQPVYEDITLEGSLIEEKNDIKKQIGEVAQELPRDSEIVEQLSLVESIESSDEPEKDAVDLVENQLADESKIEKICEISNKTQVNNETSVIQQQQIDEQQERNIDREPNNSQIVGQFELKEMNTSPEYTKQNIDKITQGNVLKDSETIDQLDPSKSELDASEISLIIDSDENTSKLLEEIEEVLNKSDEIKQKHLEEMQLQEGETPLTEEFECDKLSQETNLSVLDKNKETSIANGSDKIIENQVSENVKPDQQTEEVTAKSINEDIKKGQLEKLEQENAESDWNDMSQSEKDFDGTVSEPQEIIAETESQRQEIVSETVCQSEEIVADIESPESVTAETVAETLAETIKDIHSEIDLQVKSQSEKNSEDSDFQPVIEFELQPQEIGFETESQYKETVAETESQSVPAETVSVSVTKKQIENVSTPRRSTRRTSLSAETFTTQVAESIGTPRRSSRRASLSAETINTAEITLTPRRSTRRASMSAEPTTTFTPTKKVTIRPLAAVNEAPLTPKRVTSRRSSVSMDEPPKPELEVKTPRAKTPLKQRMVIPEEMAEDMGAIIEEDEEPTREKVTSNEDKKDEQEIVSNVLEFGEKKQVAEDTNILKTREKESTGEVIAEEVLDLEEKELAKETLETKQIEIADVVEEVQETKDKEVEAPYRTAITDEVKTPAVEEQNCEVIKKSVKDLKQDEVDNALLETFLQNDDTISTPDIKEIVSKDADTIVISDEEDTNENGKEVYESKDIAALKSKKSFKLVADLPKTPVMTGMRELLKTPKAEMNTPKFGGIRNLIRTPKLTQENEEDETEKLAVVAALVKTPQAEVSVDLEEVEEITTTSTKVSTPKTKKFVKIIANSPKTPVMAGMRELLKTPKAELSTPKYAGIRDLVRTPKLAQDNEEEEEMETLAVVADLVTTPKAGTSKDLLRTSKANISEDLKEQKEEFPTTSTQVYTNSTPKTKKSVKIIADSPKTPVMTGMRELLKTPKTEHTPKFVGIRNLIQTPKLTPENDEDEIEKLAVIATMVKTPQVKISQDLEDKSDEIEIAKATESSTPTSKKSVITPPNSPKTPIMTETRELLKTPKADSTPKFVGILNLTLENEEEIKKLDGVTDLVKTPQANISQNVEVPVLEEMPTTSTKYDNLRGVKELLTTPKCCSTPRFKGMRELMQTPKMCSTPLMMGIKELMDTPSKVENKNLDKFLKTPRAKNIMIHSLPSSAIIEKSTDSIEVSTEYDLNSTHEVGSSANLEELFKTPVASRFIERITESYYGEEDEEYDETVEKFNKTEEKETLQEKLNKSAEEAFDKLIGQESQIQTPIRKIYSRKSLQTPHPHSPFSSADVLSDLPKTDVEEWIGTLDQAEPPTIVEDDDEDVNDSVQEVSEDEVSIVDVSLQERDTNLTKNESIIPETCVKVYLSEKSITNVTTTSEVMLNSSTIKKDPLSNTTAKPKQKVTRPVTPIDAEISGIGLLDQTLESVHDELLALDEPLQMEEPSMFEEHLVVSDNESEADEIVNNLEETLEDNEDANDLSEPLLVSDNEDLDVSQEQNEQAADRDLDSGNDDTKVVKTAEGDLEYRETNAKESNSQEVTETSNIGEKSMLVEDTSEEPSSTKDPLGSEQANTQDVATSRLDSKNMNKSINNEDGENSLTEEEPAREEPAIIEILVLEDSILEDEVKNNSKDKETSNFKEVKDFNINSKEVETDPSTDFEYVENSVLENSIIEDSFAETKCVEEPKAEICSTSVSALYETTEKTANSETQIAAEKEQDSEAITTTSENVEELLKTHETFDLSEILENEKTLEVSCKETGNVSNILMANSATEISTVIDKSINNENKKEFVGECDNIFMDSSVTGCSKVDDSLVDEASNEEKDVENESAMVEVTTKEKASSNDAENETATIEAIKEDIESVSEDEIGSTAIGEVDERKEIKEVIEVQDDSKTTCDEKVEYDFVENEAKITQIKTSKQIKINKTTNETADQTEKLAIDEISNVTEDLTKDHESSSTSQIIEETEKDSEIIEQCTESLSNIKEEHITHLVEKLSKSITESDEKVSEKNLETVEKVLQNVLESNEELIVELREIKIPAMTDSESKVSSEEIHATYESDDKVTKTYAEVSNSQWDESTAELKPAEKDIEDISNLQEVNEDVENNVNELQSMPEIITELPEKVEEYSAESNENVSAINIEPLEKCSQYDLEYYEETLEIKNETEQKNTVSKKINATDESKDKVKVTNSEEPFSQLGESISLESLKMEESETSKAIKEDSSSVKSQEISSICKTTANDQLDNVKLLETSAEKKSSEAETANKIENITTYDFEVKINDIESKKQTETQSVDAELQTEKPTIKRGRGRKGSQSSECSNADLELPTTSRPRRNTNTEEQASEIPVAIDEELQEHATTTTEKGAKDKLKITPIEKSVLEKIEENEEKSSISTEKLVDKDIKASKITEVKEPVKERIDEANRAITELPEKVEEYSAQSNENVSAINIEPLEKCSQYVLEYYEETSKLEIKNETEQKNTVSKKINATDESNDKVKVTNSEEPFSQLDESISLESFKTEESETSKAIKEDSSSVKSQEISSICKNTANDQLDNVKLLETSAEKKSSEAGFYELVEKPSEAETDNKIENITTYDFEVKINDIESKKQTETQSVGAELQTEKPTVKRGRGRKGSQSSEFSNADLELPTTSRARRNTNTEEQASEIPVAIDEELQEHATTTTEKGAKGKLKITPIEKSVLEKIEENEEQSSISTEKLVDKDIKASKITEVKEPVKERINEAPVLEVSVSVKTDTIEEAKKETVKPSRLKRTASESSQGSVQDDDNNTTTRRGRRKVQKIPVEETVVEEKQEIEELSNSSPKEALVEEMPKSEDLSTISSEEETVPKETLVEQKEENKDDRKELLTVSPQKETKVIVEEAKEQDIKRSRRKPTVPESSQSSVHKDDITTRRGYRKVQKTPIEEILVEEKQENIEEEQQQLEPVDNLKELNEHKTAEELETVNEIVSQKGDVKETLTETEEQAPEIPNETEDPAETVEAAKEHVIKRGRRKLTTSESSQGSVNDEDTTYKRKARRKLQKKPVEGPLVEEIPANEQLPIISTATSIKKEKQVSSHKIEETTVEQKEMTEKHLSASYKEEEKNKTTKSAEVNEISNQNEEVQSTELDKVNENLMQVLEAVTEKEEQQVVDIPKEIDAQTDALEKDLSVKRGRRKPTVSESSQDSVHNEDNTHARRARRKVQKTPVEDPLLEEKQEELPIISTSSKKDQHVPTVTVSKETESIKESYNKGIVSEETSKDTTTSEEVKEEQIVKHCRRKPTVSESSQSSIHEEPTTRKGRRKLQKTPVDGIVEQVIEHKNLLTVTTDLPEEVSTTASTEVNQSETIEVNATDSSKVKEHKLSKVNETETSEVDDVVPLINTVKAITVENVLEEPSAEKVQKVEHFFAGSDYQEKDDTTSSTQTAKLRGRRKVTASESSEADLPKSRSTSRNRKTPTDQPSTTSVNEFPTLFEEFSTEVETSAAKVDKIVISEIEKSESTSSSTAKVKDIVASDDYSSKSIKCPVGKLTEEQKPTKKRGKRTRTASESSQGSIIDEEPTKRRVRHHTQMAEIEEAIVEESVTEETKAKVVEADEKQPTEISSNRELIEETSTEVTACEDKDEVDEQHAETIDYVKKPQTEDVSKKTQRSVRRRGAATTHEDHVEQQEEQTTKSGKVCVKQDDNYEQQTQDISHEPKNTELSKEHHTSPEEKYKEVRGRRGRKPVVAEDHHKPKEEHHETKPVTKRRAVAKLIADDHEECVPVSKRRVGRRKQDQEQEEYDHVTAENSKHQGETFVDAIAHEEPKNGHSRGNKDEYPEEPENPTISPRKENKDKVSPKEIAHTESDSASSKRRIGRRKLDNEEGHHVTADDNKDHQDKSGEIAVHDEPKKGRGGRKKDDHPEQPEHPTTSHSLETKRRVRKHKESHSDNEDHPDHHHGQESRIRNETHTDNEGHLHMDDVTKKTETKVEFIAENVPQTPKRATAAPRRGRKASAIDVDKHAHIVAGEGDDTPSKRPLRKAATAYHNYDETSNDDIPAKTKKKTDSPRKSLEAAKPSPSATFTTTTVTDPVISSSTTATTTARGRTRKPTAKVQQFLEEERAKADTPKKRGLLAAATAVKDTTTPQHMPGRRGRKASTIETQVDAVETPQRMPGRRGRKASTIETEVDAVETPQAIKRGRGKVNAHTEEIQKETSTANVIEVKEKETEPTTPPSTTGAKGRRGGRKAKSSAEDHHHDNDEPPPKKSPLVLESEKQTSSLVEALTPTRSAGRRGAATAAKVRIEEDALAAAAIDPPKRGRAKKAPAAKAAAIATATDTEGHSSEMEEEQSKAKSIKGAKNKSSSPQKPDHRTTSASTIDDAEDLNTDEENESDIIEKPINKRGARKIAASTTATDSPAVPPKRVRKAKTANESTEQTTTEVSSVPAKRTTRARRK